MSGLMRNVIDQVLRNMGEEERARSIDYVTDQMIAKMDNQERTRLLLAIIDRVMADLTPVERQDFSARLARHVGERLAPAGASATAGEAAADEARPS